MTWLELIIVLVVVAYIVVVLISFIGIACLGHVTKEEEREDV